MTMNDRLAAFFRQHPNEFWSRVVKSEQCWLWIGSKNHKGYGYFSLKGHTFLAHRFSWLIANDFIVESIPSGLFVCHHCDTPACVRPEHLFVGTAADNTHDAMKKGRLRHHSGEANRSSRLTWADVAKIRQMHTEGLPLRRIALHIGVGRSTVLAVVQNKTWPDPSWKFIPRPGRVINRTTDEIAAKIIEAMKGGEHHASVSTRLGISVGTIYAIMKRKDVGPFARPVWRTKRHESHGQIG